jgi:hypothetical protein
MMAAINSKRVWIGTLAGGLVWTVWGFATMMLLIGPDGYKPAQLGGVFLVKPRYPYFPVVWILSLFAMSYAGAWFYARLRGVMGAGPKTALCIGAWLGFAAGFPGNFAQSAWLNASRMLPLAWMLDLWGGAILATVVAGWLYKD